jgi:hypothetical protein
LIAEQKLFRGIDWFWIDKFIKYPATTHTCVLTILKNNTTVLDLTPTANDVDFEFTLLYKDNILTNGVYQYQYSFTLNGVTTTPFSGEFVVYTGSRDEQILAALYAAQLRLIGRDYTTLSINGRNVTFKTDSEIARMITIYERKIGIKTTPRILTRFV